MAGRGRNDEWGGEGTVGAGVDTQALLNDIRIRVGYA